MNVYVESNFVLELALLQEEHASCEEILNLCDGKRAQLVVPAYALVEPYETLTRRHKQRKRMKQELDAEFLQIARSVDHEARLRRFQDLTVLLISVAAEERKHLQEVCFRLLETAQIVPIDSSTLADSMRYQRTYGLSGQDAVIYSAVLAHLRGTGASQSCFLSKNSKDFNDQNLVDELRRFNCKYLRRFNSGLRYILNALS